MEKVILALLKVKFAGVDVNALMEIIHATPNPVVATELLCGLYEAPVINPLPKPEYRPTSETNFIMQSFDKFKNEITYTYTSVKSKEVWLKKGQALPAFEDTTVVSVSDYYYREDMAKKLGLSDEEAKTYEKRYVLGPVQEGIKTSTCSLSSWQ